MSTISFVNLPKQTPGKTPHVRYPVEYDEHFQQQHSPEDCSVAHISFSCPTCRGAIHITICREPDFRFRCTRCGQAFRLDCWDPLYVLREKEEKQPNL